MSGDAERALLRARSLLARRALALPSIDSRLGEITLSPRQRLVAARAAARVALAGGVLVAEPVGAGKTYIALAVARAATSLAVIAPAALRDRWLDALVRTRLRATVLSFDVLARRGPPPLAPDWVVIDESHHLRNPRTKRWAAAAALCRGARLVLLTATPIHNHAGDLAAQLALWLGERASTLDDAGRAAHVVRAAAYESLGDVPIVGAPRRVALPDDGLLDAIASLPVPVPLADGGDGGPLLRWTLVRRWASSRAALLASLRRRLAATLAVRHALEDGRHPSRAELAAWRSGDDGVQLALAPLVSDTLPRGTATLLRAARRQERALRSLLARIASAPVDADAARAEALRAIRAAHPGERIVAFGEHADTVLALARRLRAERGLAWLTARGARVAGGPLGRREVVRQLGPDPPPIPAHERIDVLLATDVLSEGLDLQGASVLVHLDLPWNPARLEQRVGRLRRPGARAARVATYLLAPPAPAEHVLRVEARLRRKLRVQGATFGAAFPLLDRWPAADDPPRALADRQADVAHAFAGWIDASEDADDDAGCAVAAVRAERAGWLAAVGGAGNGEATVLACVRGAISTEPGALLRAIHEVESGRAADVDHHAARRALARIERWLARRRMATLVAPDARPLGQRLARRLARAAVALGHTGRVALATELRAARDVVAGARDAGSERVLTAILAEAVDDAEWVRRVAALARVRSAPEARRDGGRPLALILLRPAVT